MNVPDGWTKTSLGELASSNAVFCDGDWVESKDQDPEGDVRLIQLADIGDGLYKSKSRRFLTSVKASELRCTFLKPGDLLIARMPDPLGRTCIFPGDPKSSVTVVGPLRVRVPSTLSIFFIEIVPLLVRVPPVFISFISLVPVKDAPLFIVSVPSTVKSAFMVTAALIITTSPLLMVVPG